MNRLSVRLLASHTLVAVIGGATAYLLVRLLVPQLYDAGVRGHAMMGRGIGPGLREVAVTATNNALAIGVLAGVLTAVAAGTYTSARIMRPLRAVSAATHTLAQGRYDQQVAVPAVAELAAVARDVNALGTRLAETEARRVRLLGEVAHEMRTPLTVLDGYLEGMADGVFDPTPEVLTELGGEVRRLHRLADDLSALSRAEEGRLELRRDVVDLARVATQAAERLRPQLQDADVALEVAADGPLLVRGDADRLAQVVTNLLGNALTATPAGGRVRVETAARGPEAVLTVADTGTGLAAEDLERVFERFYRAPGARAARSGTGSGIGLTIARGIAEAHGGTLRAASPGPGQGATFTLILPR